MASLRVGVVGYCPPTKFDPNEAKRLVVEVFDEIEREYPGIDITVVSGLTAVGVLDIAYREATERDWRTVGIACKRALEHELFPVTEWNIVGDEWGDESKAFLNAVDLLVRIGGGHQSYEEIAATRNAGKPVKERELAALPS